MSTRPKRSTAALMMASQFVSELGRLATTSTLPPSAVQASATFFSSAALPAESTTLAPAPASTFAASAPNAPDAPVTIAVLPRTSNSESGFFRKSSDMGMTRWLRSLASSPRLSPRRRGFAGTTDLLHRRDGDEDRAHLVAAIDDLAILVGPD